MNQIYKSQIRQLRSDARKLSAIAKHLRQQAQDLTNETKFEAKAEKARTTFFSKPSKIDPTLIIEPKPEKEIFL